MHQRSALLPGMVSPDTEYRKSHLVSLMQYSLSLAEAKCVTVLMYLASLQYEKDRSQIVFTSTLKEVSKLTGVTYHCDVFRGLLAGLRGKEVVLNYIGKHGELREKSMNIIAETDVATEEGTTFSYQFPETIRKQLMEPDYYTLIRMMTIPEIGSKYTYAIYEYCKSYLGIGLTEARSIEGWRGFLCLGSEYPVFAELERNVFKKAENEINSNKNIEIKVSYRKIKAGKKIGSIQFMVGLKAKEIGAGGGVHLVGQEITADALLKLLPEKTRTDKNRELLSGYLEQRGGAYCVGNIQYTYENCSQEKAFSSYLAKALQDDWGHEVCKRRATDEKYRSLKGGRPRITDLDPIADQIYSEAFEMASSAKKDDIQRELDRRLLSGSIKKILPRETRIRQTMQYMEVWL